MSIVKYVVSVNGNPRFNIELDSKLNNQEMESAVMDDKQYLKAVGGCNPRKCVIVRNKIINFVL